MADEDAVKELRAFRREDARWRALQLQSSHERKRVYVPTVDPENPFRAESQLRDQYELRELNRNPRLYLPSQTRQAAAKRQYRKGLPATSPRGYVDHHPASASTDFHTHVKRVLPKSVLKPKAVKSGGRRAIRSSRSSASAQGLSATAPSGSAGGNAATASQQLRTAGTRRRRQKKQLARSSTAGGRLNGPRKVYIPKQSAAPSFGHRPASASRHLDVLTMNATRAPAGREKSRAGGYLAPPPPEPKPGSIAQPAPGSGLLKAVDLARMLRGDATSAAQVLPHAGVGELAQRSQAAPLLRTALAAAPPPERPIDAPPEPGEGPGGPFDPDATVPRSDVFMKAGAPMTIKHGGEVIGPGQHGSGTTGRSSRSRAASGFSSERTTSSKPRLSAEEKKAAKATAVAIRQAREKAKREGLLHHPPTGVGSGFGVIPELRVPKFQMANGKLAEGGYLAEEYEFARDVEAAQEQGNDVRRARMWRRTNQEAVENLTELARMGFGESGAPLVAPDIEVSGSEDNSEGADEGGSEWNSEAGDTLGELGFGMRSGTIDGAGSLPMTPATPGLSNTGADSGIWGEGGRDSPGTNVAPSSLEGQDFDGETTGHSAAQDDERTGGNSLPSIPTLALSLGRLKRNTGSVKESPSVVRRRAAKRRAFTKAERAKREKAWKEAGWDGTPHILEPAQFERQRYLKQKARETELPARHASDLLDRFTKRAAGNIMDNPAVVFCKSKYDMDDKLRGDELRKLEDIPDSFNNARAYVGGGAGAEPGARRMSAIASSSPRGIHSGDTPRTTLRRDRTRGERRASVKATAALSDSQVAIDPIPSASGGAGRRRSSVVDRALGATSPLTPGLTSTPAGFSVSVDGTQAGEFDAPASHDGSEY